MRKTAIAITAVLIATAPIAHANSFIGSASESKGASEVQNPSILSVIMSRLNGHSSGATSEKKSPTADECAEKQKTASRNSSAKPHAGGEDTDMTEPTGPEPIYFGF